MIPGSCCDLQFLFPHLQRLQIEFVLSVNKCIPQLEKRNDCLIELY